MSVPQGIIHSLTDLNVNVGLIVHYAETRKINLPSNVKEAIKIVKNEAIELSEGFKAFNKVPFRIYLLQIDKECPFGMEVWVRTLIRENQKVQLTHEFRCLSDENMEAAELILELQRLTSESCRLATPRKNKGMATFVAQSVDEAMRWLAKPVAEDPKDSPQTIPLSLRHLRSLSDQSIKVGSKSAPTSPRVPISTSSRSDLHLRTLSERSFGVDSPSAPLSPRTPISTLSQSIVEKRQASVCSTMSSSASTQSTPRRHLKHRCHSNKIRRSSSSSRKSTPRQVSDFLLFIRSDEVEAEDFNLETLKKLDQIARSRLLS